jgi:DNA topoisomerase-2
MTKHIQQTYKVLDEIDHIRQRTGMYAGSITSQTSLEWIFNPETKKMEKRSISYIPAFIKIFSEILDNAIDEGKRASTVLDTIKVDLTFDEISVSDNGRGIPVEIHEQTGTYIAETVFSNLRAGSNFNDDEDQSLIGTNGVGSTLTNVLSSNFKIESCDGKKKLTQDFWNGMRERSEPTIKQFSKNGTKITFTPDYEFFKLTGLDTDHTHKIFKKVIDAAASNLNIKFYFNNELIKFKSFDDYIALYSDEFLTDCNDDWKVGISSSDGFEQISFINSVETYQGGTHVDYVTTQITTKLREYFKKKHKVDVKPSDIKNHLQVFIFGTVNRPRFSSQTKENMISPSSEWKTSWTISDKFVKNILKTEIVQSILDWVLAKEKAQLMADLRKTNKNLDKADPKRVEKFHDASTKIRSDAMLFLAEGDSALSGLLSGRDPKTMAAFPLRGKPINVFPMELKDILENREFKNIMTITGLQFGVKVESVSDLRFGRIVLSTDSDLDGFGIRGLLLNAFYKFWPELFDLNIIYILNTPIVKVKYKKDVLSFYDVESFVKWKESKVGQKFESKYYKGLGTSSSKEWKEYLSDLETNFELVKTVGVEDSEIFKLQFSKEVGMTDKRKEWLGIEG